MVNYVRAELYKVLHRKYTYIFLGVMLVLESLLVAGWVFNNINGYSVGFYSGVGILTSVLSFGLYMTLLTGDLVFSDQFKSNTLKNEVSYGIPRTRIFLGKLIVQCIVAFVLCLLFLAYYIGACYLLLPHGPEDGMVMGILGYCLLVALPLWLGGQALANMMLFCIKSSTMASLLFVAVLGVVPPVVRQLGLLGGSLVNQVSWMLYQIMLPAPFDNLTSAMDWALLGKTCVIGLGWFAGATAIGLLVFRRREIS